MLTELLHDVLAGPGVELLRVTPGRAVRRGGVLIDPWIAERGADDAQLAALRRLFDGDRRRWTLPLAVLDSADAQSDKEHERLLGDLEHVQDGAGALTSEAARRGARGVTSIGEFATMLPVMVTEAERQYIKYSSDFRRAEAPSSGGDGRSRH